MIDGIIFIVGNYLSLINDLLENHLREETISDGSENNFYCIKCYYIYLIICWSSAQGAFYTLDLTLTSVLWFSAFVYSFV